MEKPTVLIIEDDENIRELYRDAFQDAGLGVLTASDGANGVELALLHHPNAVLVDIMMPGGMNGHEVAHAIRKDTWGKTAVIIYLTNMTDAGNVVEAVNQKRDDYIIKANMTPKEVVNHVRMAMKA